MENFEQNGDAGGVVMAVLQARIQGDVEVLKAKRSKQDEGGKDLTGAASGEPAIDPGEDHAGEGDVYQCVDGKQERCPGQKRGSGNADADIGGDKSQSADDIGCAEVDEEEGCGAIARKTG